MLPVILSIFLLVFVAGINLQLLATSHLNALLNPQRDDFYAAAAAAAASATDKEQQLCSNGGGDGLSMKAFLHPRSLNHGMSDEEVFWTASLLVPRREEGEEYYYPFDRVPRVAFMFLTRGPLPLLPLWERFFKGHDGYFSVYVHAGTPGFVLNVSAGSPFYGRQIPSKPVEWGTISLLDAERRLLANALLEFSNERFVLLSETCIPIYNFQTAYNYLVGSRHGFVESNDDPSWSGRGRYSEDMLPDISIRHWRKGSQWFEMQRTLAAYVVSDKKYHGLFEKHCTGACYPDEHFLPTLVNMFRWSRNSNRTVTWADWSGRRRHPATYGAANTTEGLVRSIRENATSCSYNSGVASVCHLFARKFDASALGALLSMASTVMEF